MPGKTEYTAEEWRIVGGAPEYAAAFIVSSAEHHAIGTIRDMLTATRAFTTWDTPTALLRDVRADIAGDNGDPGPTKHTPENIARLRALLVRAAALVDEREPVNADSYKRALLDIATAAAEAGKGGILGTSGALVGDDEQHALDDLARILRIAPRASASH